MIIIKIFSGKLRKLKAVNKNYRKKTTEKTVTEILTGTCAYAPI